MNILFKYMLFPILTIQLLSNCYSVETQAGSINNNNHNSYIPLTNKEYEIVNTIIYNFTDKLPKNGFSLEFNRQMQREREIIVLLESHFETISNYYEEIYNFINESSDLKTLFNNNEIINYEFYTMYCKMLGIKNLHLEIFNSIFFNRLFSINKIPLSENYPCTLQFKQQNSQLFNELLSFIDNKLTEEQRNILTKTNNWKIIDMFKYYRTQYAKYCKQLINKVDTIYYASNLSKYSSYMIKYSSIVKKYNDLYSNYITLYNNNLTNTSENLNMTKCIGKFSKLLIGFKTLINNQLKEHIEIEQEYYVKNRNNKLNTLEHLHNIKDY